MNTPYKILLFDLDDTLINNKENVKHAFQNVLEKRNETYTNEKFQRRYEIDKKFWKDWQDGKITLPAKYQQETGKKSKGFLNRLRAQRILIYFNNTVSFEEAISLNNIYMHSLTEVVIAIDGAYETLEYLSSKYDILVATNWPSVATKEKLEKINCLRFVKEILSADMFGYMKPKVEFFEGIQEMYQLPKEAYLIIGDSLKSDVGFGMNCGIDSCRFDRGNETLTEAYQPTMIIKQLSELKERL